MLLSGFLAFHEIILFHNVKSYGFAVIRPLGRHSWSFVVISWTRLRFSPSRCRLIVRSKYSFLPSASIRPLSSVLCRLTSDLRPLTSDLYSLSPRHRVSGSPRHRALPAACCPLSCSSCTRIATDVVNTRDVSPAICNLIEINRGKSPWVLLSH